MLGAATFDLSIIIDGDIIKLNNTTYGDRPEMQCEPNYWIVAAQFGTPLALALVGFFFTRKQIEISRNKLRLDHFDKRFAVFEAARAFLEQGLVHSDVSIPHQNKFLIDTTGATFLFDDPKVVAYLAELRTRVIDLPFKLDEMKSANETDRAAAQKVYLDERRWLRDQYTAIEEIFRPSLQLKA